MSVKCPGQSSRESKWQPLNGSRRIVRKSAKTDSQKRSETDSSKSAQTSEKVQKLSKTSENRRNNTKKIVVLLFLFLLPSSGGHIAVAVKVFPGSTSIETCPSTERITDFDFSLGSGGSQYKHGGAMLHSGCCFLEMV